MIFKKMARSLKEGGKLGFWSGFGYWPDYRDSLFTPVEAFSQDFMDALGNSLYTITSDEFKALISSNNLEIVTWKEAKFTRVEELLEFYMWSTSGQFDSTHFCTDILKQHYRGGGSINLPKLLAVVVKHQFI